MGKPDSASEGCAPGEPLRRRGRFQDAPNRTEL